jgi:YXWGXW repeat-containing protein
MSLVSKTEDMHMWKRKALFAALVASTLATFPLAASADREIIIDSAPPPPREEVVPAPRHGYVWAPGFWEWRHGHHVWVRGHWEREHRGMYWHPSRWSEREGRWVFERGHWDRERFAENRLRDRDHDGVPNRFDRDKDGDGVPNRFDRAPNNPNIR